MLNDDDPRIGEAFSALAAPVLAGLGDPRSRKILRSLAEVAADCPMTPGEIGYQRILREIFWTLATGDPPLEPDDVTWCLMLALESLDRGGFIAAADVCHGLLDYLAGLPGYESVVVTEDGVDVVMPIKPPEA